MTAYIVVRIGAVTDTARYDTYRSKAKTLLATHGARYLVRSSDEELAEGNQAERFTIIEFPSLEAIHSFWHSPEYSALREIRQDAVDLTIGFVDGATP